MAWLNAKLTLMQSLNTWMTKMHGKFIMLAIFISLSVNAGPLDETRYCGAPQRYADGSIKRSSAVTVMFKVLHPCPSTLSAIGPCPGWQMNHVLPLACGGCDTVSNLVWVPVSIKTCTESHCVDRYERRISASNPPQPNTGACINQIVP